MSHTSELSAVRDFWNAAPCGSRYLETNDDYENHARARYGLEPFILEFADFQRWRGKKVLEIGVGMGADYVQWLKAGAIATGMDLSSASLERAAHRCALAGVKPDLHLGNAEELPFPDGQFDLVYSYGVLHHSPDTLQCLREARRVLKPGGRAKLMVYHHPSLVGLMLWARYGALRGKSEREVVFHHLESPGTKAFTQAEASEMMTSAGFKENSITMRQVFSPGDLLLNRASNRFQSPLYRTVWKLYPRWLARRLGKKRGLFLLIEAA